MNQFALFINHVARKELCCLLPSRQGCHGVLYGNHIGFTHVTSKLFAYPKLQKTALAFAQAIDKL